jgi:hypothetical protein
MIIDVFQGCISAQVLALFQDDKLKRERNE